MRAGEADSGVFGMTHSLAVAPSQPSIEIVRTCHIDYDEIRSISQDLSVLIGKAKSRLNSGTEFLSAEEVRVLEESWRIFREMVG